MDILISSSSNKHIYEQIVYQIKGMILNGTLQDGEALPSMRLLARELRISVITTKRAYDELEREGLITTVTGKGSFICSKNAHFIKEQKLMTIEENLKQAIETSKESGLSLKELTDLLTELYSNLD